MTLLYACEHEGHRLELRKEGEECFVLLDGERISEGFAVNPANYSEFAFRSLLEIEYDRYQAMKSLEEVRFD